MFYKNTMLKLFRSLSPQEFCMKLILYMIYMKNTQDNSPSSNKDDEYQDCQEYHPDKT